MADKYTWQDIGSSYLPGEIIAAFLWAQLQEATKITERRKNIWQMYHERLKSPEHQNLLLRPTIPAECTHNAHMYYVLLPSHVKRQSIIKALSDDGISAPFHYVSLHTSPAGLKFGRFNQELPITLMASEQLLRLPLWIGMDDDTVSKVCESLVSALNRNLPSATRKAII
jgi:dTDP-4-amino-4,6-dideoxygalactose transaminase